MAKSYVLIDYENVQPASFAPLKHPDFHIHVFIGSSQKTLTTKVVTALQPFGENAKYVQISGNGKNAADFHIAYYAGHLIARESDAACYIVSKDKGFDPLVKHLKEKGLTSSRVTDINKIPVLKKYSGNSVDAKVEKIVANLKSRRSGVPNKEKSLINTINNLFGTTIKAAEMDNLLGRMKNLGFLEIENGKIRLALK